MSIHTNQLSCVKNCRDFFDQCYWDVRRSTISWLEPSFFTPDLNMNAKGTSFSIFNRGGKTDDGSSFQSHLLPGLEEQNELERLFNISCYVIF